MRVILKATIKQSPDLLLTLSRRMYTSVYINFAVSFEPYVYKN